MVSMFKNRITSEQAAEVLSNVTEDIRTRYVSSVFPQESLPDIEIVNGELFFLAIYVIDGLIKNTTDASWVRNGERLAKNYYSKCAALIELDVTTLSYLLIDKMNFYNLGLLEHVSEVMGIRERDDRLSVLGPHVGNLFADLCDCPEDGLHQLIGAGAFLTINLSTERFLAESGIVD